MTLLVQISMLSVGLVLLVLGAEALVRGAVRLAASLGLPSLVIGLTVVAFGTSAPELVTSVRAALAGSPDIAIGNVLGSNVANILLILGVTAAIRPVPVQRSVLVHDTPMMIGVTIFAIALMLPWGGEAVLTRLDGVLLTAGIVLFILHSYLRGKRDPRLAAEVEEHEAEVEGPPMPLWRSVVFVVVGSVMLAGGAELLVRGASGIARGLGVPEMVIALTMVAFGTSVPELAASVAAALRRSTAIAVGNVIGSNIFNLLGVLGPTALITSVGVSGDAVSRDVWVVLGVALLCVPIFASRRRIGRAEGVGMFALYCGYIAWLYMSG